MKTKIFFQAIVFLFIAVVATGVARADMNAQATVDAFNSASGGSQMVFTYSYNYEVNLTQRSGYSFADTSAYEDGVTGSSNYYRTFCVEPNVGAYTMMGATLNYENGKSTTSSGYSLSVGAAYLYSQFAAGSLEGYTYNNTSARSTSSSNLLSAIRGLMGISTLSWTNAFTNYLLTINSDKNFWTQTYDPNQYYDVIGDYSVFVMNCYSSTNGANGQDFLYVASAKDSSDTPEPASVLLWTLGSFGALGAARRARKQREKLANA